MASAVVDAIGATGAVLTTLCWVPQAVKIVRERETRAISLRARRCRRSEFCCGSSMGARHRRRAADRLEHRYAGNDGSHSGAQDPPRLTRRSCLRCAGEQRQQPLQ